MATIETLVTLHGRGDLLKRIEKKHTKASMARLLADVYELDEKEGLSDAEKWAELKKRKFTHSIVWG